MKHKEQAIKLRQSGMSIKDISTQLHHSKSTISLWVRNVLLTEEATNIINANTIGKTKLRDAERMKAYGARRLVAQEKGRTRVHKEDKEYLAGCMLYWAEGAKGINTVTLVNSDVHLICTFKNFLQKFFQVHDEKLILVINCYTDVYSLEEIEAFWLSNLRLNKSNLRKGQTNNVPSSSKSTKRGKCPYGTCCIKVNDTYIVQEIFGAIQEYGGFTNPNWLSQPTRKRGYHPNDK